MSRFTEYDDPRAGTTTKTIYHKDSHKCACKGTGLVPPDSERINGECQSYCPVHKCVRYWPQAQADGTTKFFELGPSGLTNKEMPMYKYTPKKRG